jgi:Zn-dependent protease
VIDPRNSLYVGHLGPIPLYLHWSFLILLLLAWQWVGTTASPVIIISFLLVLLSGIILHELGHGLTSYALARDASGRSILIVLWAMGGVCFSQREGRPWKELLIVLAGPAVSLALLLVGYASLVALAQTSPETLGIHSVHADAFIAEVNACTLSPFTYGAPKFLSTTGVLLWLLLMINKMLLIFNMLPIYPLDGGQALHNVLKMSLKDYDLARKISFALSIALAAAYYFWRMQNTPGHQPDLYLAVLLGFLLYNAYNALFIYRR